MASASRSHGSAAAPPSATPPLATISKARPLAGGIFNQLATSVAATMSGSLAVFAAKGAEQGSHSAGGPRPVARPAPLDGANLSGSSQRAAASPFSGHQLVASKKVVSS
jgi:hypothetical protein